MDTLPIPYMLCVYGVRAGVHTAASKTLFTSRASPITQHSHSHMHTDTH